MAAADKFKDLIPKLLTSSNIDPDAIMSKTITMMGLLLDDIQLKVNTFLEIVRNDYSDIERVPNGIMQTLFAQSLGIDLKNIHNLNYTDNDTQLFKVWNRIMNNLFYILKTKGTRSAIKYCMVLYGIDPNTLSINEFTDTNSSERQYIKQTQQRIPFVSGGNIYFNGYGFGLSGNAGTFEVLVKRDTVGELIRIPYADGTISLKVDNGAVTATIGSVVSSYTASLSTFSINSYYGLSFIKNSSGLQFYRHNKLRSDLNSSTSILIANYTTTASFSSVTASASSLFNSTLTAGGFTELKAWNHIVSTSDLEYRLFNYASISTTGSLTGLLNRYRFNENRTVSANMNNVSWFYNVANTSITSSLSTNSLSANPLSSIYSYISSVREDRISTFGIQPIQNKIGLSADSEFSNLVSVGYSPVRAFNNFMYDRDKNFNMISLYGNNEEYYNSSISSIDIYLNAVYTDWRSRFINLSNYDQILDSTEYMLASFFEFISQIKSIKTIMIEQGNIIKANPLSNISLKRKDTDANTNINVFSPKLQSKIINALNSYYQTISTYSNIFDSPQLNIYYRDEDGEIITPIETNGDTDATININMFAAGNDYLIISNDAEDYPYNFIENDILVIDSEGDAVVGARIRATAPGIPDQNVWQFIDVEGGGTFTFQAEFINTDETGVPIQIKYDASSRPFTELDERQYNFLFKTVNLGNGIISKPITTKLARNIKTQLLETITFRDAFLKDPFIGIASQILDGYLFKETIDLRLFTAILTYVNTVYEIQEKITLDFIRFLITSQSDVYEITDQPFIFRNPIMILETSDTLKLYEI